MINIQVLGQQLWLSPTSHLFSLGLLVFNHFNIHDCLILRTHSTKSCLFVSSILSWSRVAVWDTKTTHLIYNLNWKYLYFPVNLPSMAIWVNDSFGDQFFGVAMDDPIRNDVHSFGHNNSFDSNSRKYVLKSSVFFGFGTGQSINMVR